MLSGLIIGVLVIISVYAWIDCRYPSGLTTPFVKRHDPYDLNLLKEIDTRLKAEKYGNVITDDRGSYCRSCDEPYPAGTIFCRNCGRPL